jgi:tetratricopeptide (TPR) repeat protein
MRIIVHIKSFVLAFCLLASVSAFAANPVADSAAKAYQRQEFKLAASLYEKLLGSGETSSALHYNLGNCYYKGGELGKAIYQYELAKKLSPNDDDINNNLRIANDKLIDKIESKENFFAGAIQSGVYTLLSVNGWAWLSIFSLLLALAFFFLFISAGNLTLKRAGFWLGTICGISFILSFGIGYAALHNLNKKTKAIVVSNESKVLSAPDANAKSKFTLHAGTKLNVLNTNEEWTAIQLANGNEGWVRTNELGLF